MDVYKMMTKEEFCSKWLHRSADTVSDLRREMKCVRLPHGIDVPTGDFVLRYNVNGEPHEMIANDERIMLDYMRYKGRTCDD